MSVADPPNAMHLVHNGEPFDTRRCSRQSTCLVTKKGPPRRLLGDLTLVRGDVLFIPGGVWHVAGATEVLPTAHLSFGVQPVTALHWLSSLRTGLRDGLDWRRELPEDIESWRRWVDALRNSILERLTLKELSIYLKTRRRPYLGDQ